MPIVVVPPPSTEPEPGTGQAARERWIWVSPDGEELELTGFVNGIEVVKGMGGRGAPPARIRRDRSPGKAGEKTRSATHGLREVTMPLFVDGMSWDGLHILMERLVNAMDAVKGTGILRRIHRDGTVNELNCRCVDGLRVQGEGANGPTFFRPVLIFQADDPYWYGPVQTKGFTGSTPQPWFPILPLELGRSSVIGDTSIYIDSTVETYPVWTIIGPGADPVITNTTTGKTFSLGFPAPLSAGQSVVIDTRDYVKSVTGPTGDNWRRYLTQRSLWSLAPGQNDISLEMSSSTDASYISISYRVRKLYGR